MPFCSSDYIRVFEKLSVACDEPESLVHDPIGVTDASHSLIPAVLASASILHKHWLDPTPLQQPLESLCVNVGNPKKADCASVKRFFHRPPHDQHIVGDSHLLVENKRIDVIGVQVNEAECQGFGDLGSQRCVFGVRQCLVVELARKRRELEQW